MKSDNLRVGIDLGSKTIKVVVAIENKDTGKMELLGATKEKSEGIINGQIYSVKAAYESINKAIKKTERALSVDIDRVSVGISTSCTKHIQIKTKNTVAKSSNEISELDLEKCRSDAMKSVQINSPLQILHTHLSYVYVDGKRIKGSPLGMIGHSIETVHTVTTIPKKTLENFIQIFDDLNLEVVEINHNAFMGSMPLTTPNERAFGIAVLDIGSSASVFTVYENDLPVFVNTLPVGGDSFTKDISICMSVNMAEAEDLKKNAKQIEHRYSETKDSKKINQILQARAEDLVFLIERDLNKIGNKTQIPNGIIISGGGANLYNLKEKLKQKLNIPIIEARDILKNITENILDDSSWANAYGLVLVKFENKNILNSILGGIFATIKQFFIKIAP